MANIYSYEQKKFQSGSRKGDTYINKVSVKTGKVIRSYSSDESLKTVNRAITQQKRRGKDRKEKLDVIERMARTGTGGEYEEYQKEYKKLMRDIPEKRKKAGKDPLTDAKLRGYAKAQAIEHKTGVACRYRFAWLYWMRTGTDEEGKPIWDSTPVFHTEALQRNGDDDFETMIDVCNDVYNDIQQGITHGDVCNSGPCKVQGGHCVLLYEKGGYKKILDKHEEGKGCGYSFDFSSHDKVRI